MESIAKINGKFPLILHFFDKSVKIDCIIGPEFLDIPFLSFSDTEYFTRILSQISVRERDHWNLVCSSVKI